MCLRNTCPGEDNVGDVRAGQILSEIVKGPGWNRSLHGEASEKGLSGLKRFRPSFKVFFGGGTRQSLRGSGTASFGRLGPKAGLSESGAR